MMSAVVCNLCSLELELPANGIEIPGCRCVFHAHCWELAKEQMQLNERCPACDALGKDESQEFPPGQPSPPQTLEDENSGASGGAEGKAESQEESSGTSGGAESKTARTTEQEVARMTEQPPLPAASSTADASQLVAMHQEPTCYLCGSTDDKMKSTGGVKTPIKHKCRRCCSIDTVHALMDGGRLWCCEEEDFHRIQDCHRIF